MKRIKVFILLIGLFILTGCSGNYNIKIDEDLSVTEKAEIYLANKPYLYDRTLKVIKDNKIDKKNYSVTQTSDSIKIVYKEKYDSIEDYILNSKLYKQLYDEIMYDKNNNELLIKTESKMKLDSTGVDSIVNDYNVSLLQINIETPFRVLSNNSDSSYNNTYTWNLDSNINTKKIELDIKLETKNQRIKQIIVLSLIGFIFLGFIIVTLRKIIKPRKI